MFDMVHGLFLILIFNCYFFNTSIEGEMSKHVWTSSLFGQSPGLDEELGALDERAVGLQEDGAPERRRRWEVGRESGFEWEDCSCSAWTCSTPEPGCAGFGGEDPQQIGCLPRRPRICWRRKQNGTTDLGDMPGSSNGVTTSTELIVNSWQIEY